MFGDGRGGERRTGEERGSVRANTVMTVSSFLSPVRRSTISAIPLLGVVTDKTCAVILLLVHLFMSFYME